MTPTTDPVTPEALEAALSKGGKQGLRKLEKRLATVRAVEAKRTRQAEKAERKGAAKRAAKRGRQLEKAASRGGVLEALIAELRAVVPTNAVSSKANGSGTPKAPRSQAAKPEAAEPRVLRAFCLRERKTVEMQDPKPMVMSNGRSATVGTCPSCGVRVIRPG